MTSDDLKKIKEQTDKNPDFKFTVADCEILGQEVVIRRKYIEKNLKEQ